MTTERSCCCGEVYSPVLCKKQAGRAELMQILCVFCGFLWRKTSWEGVIIVDAMCIWRLFWRKTSLAGVVIV